MSHVALTMLVVFRGLAAGTLLVLLGTTIAGFLVPALGNDPHVILAVFSLLLSCLVQCVVFTYLTVTGKLMVQAAYLGRLGLRPVIEAKSLKRAATVQVGLVFLTVVLVTATGARLWRTQEGHLEHLVAVGAALLVHGYAFYREHSLIRLNGLLLERTLKSYAVAFPSRSTLNGDGEGQSPGDEREWDRFIENTDSPLRELPIS